MAASARQADGHVGEAGLALVLDAVCVGVLPDEVAHAGVRIRRLVQSTLLPYTTLFRSQTEGIGQTGAGVGVAVEGVGRGVLRAEGVASRRHELQRVRARGD